MVGKRSSGKGRTDPESLTEDKSSTDTDCDGKAVDGSLDDGFVAEPVMINPDGTLDLHTFSPKDVPSLLNEFIYLSRKDEISPVKIIHGKGTGSLRRWVHRLLELDPRVAQFYDAHPGSGGWGATVVELRPGKEPEGETDG